MTKNVLCLDGGGVRGMSLVSFLQSAEQEFGKKTVDAFDLFAGTSIGAIATAGLVANMFSAQEVMDMVCVKGDIATIFDSPSIISRWTFNGPKHTGVGKRQIINKWIPDLKCSELAKPILIPTYNFTNSCPRLYSKDMTPEVNIRDVVDASSAAPILFPPVKVPPENNWEGDGGIFANNPSMIGLLEARRLWGDEEIRILSIGTGKTKYDIDGEKACSWGPLSWYNNNILDILMTSPMQMMQENCTRMLGDKYIRIDADLKAYDIPETMDDISDELREKLDAMGADMFTKHKDLISSFYT